MLIIVSRIVNKILSMYSNLFSTHVFMVSVLRFTPIHTPIKYRCPFKIRNRSWHIYLTSSDVSPRHKSSFLDLPRSPDHVAWILGISKLSCSGWFDIHWSHTNFNRRARKQWSKHEADKQVAFLCQLCVWVHSNSAFGGSIACKCPYQHPFEACSDARNPFLQAMGPRQNTLHRPMTLSLDTDTVCPLEYPKKSSWFHPTWFQRCKPIQYQVHDRTKKKTRQIINICKIGSSLNSFARMKTRFSFSALSFKSRSSRGILVPGALQ
jgi:uncharacterized CHY-type Zn-finger protein